MKFEGYQTNREGLEHALDSSEKGGVLYVSAVKGGETDHFVHVLKNGTGESATYDVDGYGDNLTKAQFDEYLSNHEWEQLSRRGKGVVLTDADMSSISSSDKIDEKTIVGANTQTTPSDDGIKKCEPGDVYVVLEDGTKAIVNENRFVRHEGFLWQLGSGDDISVTDSQGNQRWVDKGNHNLKVVIPVNGEPTAVPLSEVSRIEGSVQAGELTLPADFKNCTFANGIPYRDLTGEDKSNDSNYVPVTLSNGTKVYARLEGLNKAITKIETKMPIDGSDSVYDLTIDLTEGVAYAADSEGNIVYAADNLRTDLLAQDRFNYNTISYNKGVIDGLSMFRVSDLVKAGKDIFIPNDREGTLVTSLSGGNIFDNDMFNKVKMIYLASGNGTQDHIKAEDFIQGLKDFRRGKSLTMKLTVKNVQFNAYGRFKDSERIFYHPTSYAIRKIVFSNADFKTGSSFKVNIVMPVPEKRIL